jgi:spectinomycin phosphotransferase
LPIVRSRLERVEEKVIRNVVADGWGLSIGELRYVPEGGGAYHWTARGDGARRWFVTCDDLDTKPWLGSDRDAVFAGLLAAYAAAIALRATGLSFVAAPIATVCGAPAERIDERHSVSVFEYVDGEPGRWGAPVGSRECGELVTMMARLHRATPGAHHVPHRGLEVAGREGLEAALTELARPWDGGPLSELARRELAGHFDGVVRWLTELDRFAHELGATDGERVVTHGELHPGNLIRTGTGLVLVDWDTVALARPERDLWMIVDADGTVVSAYRDLTGVALDREALTAYRLLWALTDVAAFTLQLRGGHRRDADVERALTGLCSILDGREPRPYVAPTRRDAAHP